MGNNVPGKCLAEFIGTFAIVFFGAGSVCVNTQSEGILGLLGIALAFGIIVAVMVSATGHISGAHINPAVTFVCVVTKRITLPMAGIYVAAQLFGGIVAAFLLRWFFAEETLNTAHLGVTSLASSVNPIQGVVIEAILTFFLVLVIFGTAIDPRGHKLGGIAIGAVVCADILIGGPLTGASMNPARTFGPALASGFWKDHWVYWVGPLGGAVLAALAYEKVMAPQQNKS